MRGIYSGDNKDVFDETRVNRLDRGTKRRERCWWVDSADGGLETANANGAKKALTASRC